MERTDSSHMRTVAVVLTGPPGAGKSSVLDRLATLLEVDGVPFGALESEQLGWGSPWLDDEAVLAQLQAVCDLQRRAGRRRFLIAATTETSEALAELVRAVAADHVARVLLIAHPDVLAARLQAREPDAWPGKQPLIQHARALSRSMPELDGIDIRLATDTRTPQDVAVELRGRLRALGLL